MIDPELEKATEVAGSIMTLARRLREDARIKVRQPLRRLTVISREAGIGAAIERLRAIILDEVNVKDIAISTDEAAFVQITVKPNLKILGKRCGPKIKPISTALAGWSHAEVAVLAGGGTITVADEVLAIGDVLLQRSPVGGSAVASDGAISVALDTQLDEELVSEGLAREFTSILQQARKEAGLAVEDRIAVTWASDDAALVAAITTHATSIADEVLATSFSAGPGELGADLNGRALRYRLAKR
jgi:isoleucyl-tRNA synthetase